MFLIVESVLNTSDHGIQIKAWNQRQDLIILHIRMSQRIVVPFLRFEDYPIGGWKGAAIKLSLSEESYSVKVFSVLEATTARTTIGLGEYSFNLSLRLDFANPSLDVSS